MLLYDIEREVQFSTQDVQVYTITYDSEGFQVKACYAVPAAEGDYPPLLYCRGGIKAYGRVLPERMVELARYGYAVLAPHYRGNEGGEGRDAFGGDDRHDVYQAIELFDKLPRIKQEPIVSIGFSRGAFMTLLAASEYTLGPVAVWNGVSDLHLTYEERQDMRSMLRRVVGHPVKHAEEYARRSPVCWASQIRSPVLILHGTEDENVSVEHAHRLAEQLTLHQVTHELILYPNMPHRFPLQADQAALRTIFNWFAKHKHTRGGKG